MEAIKGFTGKRLRVDLTERKLHEEAITEEERTKYLGGRGMNMNVLWNEASEEVEAFDPANILVFGVGPLTGSMVTGGRFEVSTGKAPLTGLLGTGNAGGQWGAGLKYCGYDQIVVSGKSSDPVYLYLSDDKIEIRDAGHIWGKTTDIATKIIQDESGGINTHVACIGPAGENLVKYATIISSFARAGGRGGIGAVMGSKNLKAIAVNGGGMVELDQPDEFLEVVRKLYSDIKNNPLFESFCRYGSTAAMAAGQRDGWLPTRNFTSGIFEDAKKIDGKAIYDKYARNDLSCFGCPYHCNAVLEIVDGYSKRIFTHLEFESTAGLGAKCGVSHLPGIVEANLLCNAYGLDMMSTDVVLAWVMECFDNGILAEEDCDGLEITFGNHKAMVEMIPRIARREGIGSLFAEGIVRASQKIGKGSDEFAIHVKNLELVCQDPRGCQAWGLAYAVSSRGGCHNRAFPCMDILRLEKLSEKLFGTKDACDLYTPKDKGIMVKWHEDFGAVADSLLVCKYATTFTYDITPEYAANLLNKATGLDMSEDELLKIGERIINVERLINKRHGFDRRHDTLPKRFFEPMPTGPAKGLVVELEEMLDDYYTKRGWDLKTGLPGSDKLGELGLSG